MNKIRYICFFIVLSLILTSCQSTSTIKKQTRQIGQADLTIGNLNTDGVSIFIPQNALSKKTEFSLETSTSPPKISKTEGTLLGKPIKIDLKDEVKRFEKPIEIQFKISDREWKSFENPKDIMIGYYDGFRWVSLSPSKFDEKNKIVSYTTYHCSEYFPIKAEKEKIKKTISNKMALEKYIIDENSEVKKTTESLVKSVMGPNVDKSLLRDIVEGILDQNDYTQLAKAVENRNSQEIQNQFIASYTTVVANTLWAYSSNYADNLGDLGANLGLVGSFGSSASLIANGDYQKAAEELAKGIIQTHPVGKLFSSAINITNRQISRWKNEEIEAAYNIFINGKEPTIPFWGYGSINPGDFDEIWNQMRGVRRQIIIDSISDFKLENGREPNEKEKNKIEEDAKSTLQMEFKNRQSKEKFIAEAEQRNLDFLNIVEEYNLLTTNRYGYEPSDITYAERVKQIIELRNKVLIDTNRKMNFKGDDTDKEINVYTVGILISEYLSQGKEAYENKLIELGLINSSDITKFAGTYSIPLVFSNTTINNSENPMKGLSINGSATISDTNVSLTLGTDGKLSISYTANINSTQNSTTTYPSGHVENSNSSANYIVEESFNDIPLEKKLIKAISVSNIIGDRYYSGFESLDQNTPRHRSWNLEKTYVSGVLEKIEIIPDENQIVIKGVTNIEMPSTNVGNLKKSFNGTFTLNLK